MCDPDYHAAHTEPSDEKCLACGHTWEVQGLREYGSWSLFDDDDMICTECGQHVTEEI